jgi:hypothetical protein
MMKFRFAVRAGAAMLAAAMLPAQAQALIVTHVWEAGGDVRFEASGSLDTTQMTRLRVQDTGTGFLVQPSHPRIYFRGVGDVFSVPGVMAALGSGGATISGTVAGDALLFETDAYSLTDTTIVLPENYVAGSDILATATIAGRSLADLGFTAGSYSLFVPGGDELRVVVGEAPSAVPLPGALPLAAGAVGLLGLIGLRRRS